MSLLKKLAFVSAATAVAGVIAKAAWSKKTKSKQATGEASKAKPARKKAAKRSTKTRRTA